MSSQNSSHNAHLTSQGGKLQRAAHLAGHSNCKLNFRRIAQANHLLSITMKMRANVSDRNISWNEISGKTHGWFDWSHWSISNRSQLFIFSYQKQIYRFYRHWLVMETQCILWRITLSLETNFFWKPNLDRFCWWFYIHSTLRKFQYRFYSIHCTFQILTKIPRFFFCIFQLSTGPFDNSYATSFYSSNKNKAFGLNASPESAMSPSISSVATSASEVSEPKLCYLYFRTVKLRTDFRLCTLMRTHTLPMVCRLAYQKKRKAFYTMHVNSWRDSIHLIVHSTNFLFKNKPYTMLNLIVKLNSIWNKREEFCHNTSKRTRLKFYMKWKWCFWYDIEQNVYDCWLSELFFYLG